MKKNKNPSGIALAYTCLVVVSSAQKITVELTYSTDNSSTLILTTPNLTAANRDAVSYSYTMDTGGAVSGASASLFSAGSATGNTNNISALSLISGRPSYYVATSTSSVWGTLTFEPDDIILYNPVLDTASTFWEGDDHSPTGFIIDGLHVYDDGSFLLSTTTSETIYGLTFRDGDIALVNPSASSATIFFNQDLLGGSGNINAISIEKNTGNLVFSTTTSQSLAGVSFDNGDLVMWDGTTAMIVFRESNHFSLSENINALGSFSMTVPEPSSSLLLLAASSFIFLRRDRQG